MADIIALAQHRKPRAKSALTQAIVDKAEKRQERYEIIDAELPGFRLRVSPNSSAYYLWTRIGKGRAAKAKLIHIGDTRVIKLREAREKAKAFSVEAKGGSDPVKRIAAESHLETHLDTYETVLKTRGVDKRTDIMWSLRNYLKAHKREALTELRRSDFTAVMNKLEAAGKPGAADYFRKCISTFLNWCVNEGSLPASPLAGYRRERTTKSQRQVIEQFTMTKAQDIKAFWKATEQAKNPVHRDLLRFLLLTGQRRTETALIRWQNVDLKAGIWHIPAAITKTGAAHTVYLGPDSLALLKAQAKLAGTTLIFPGRNLKPISGWTQVLQPVRAAFGNAELAPHGLRRTYRTMLSEIGVEEAVAERMIAHKRADLVALYDKSLLTAKRVEAQERYEAHLGELVR
jgi:integrase